MPTKAELLQYESHLVKARNKDGKTVFIYDVNHASPSLCGCTCLLCGKPLGAFKNDYPKHFYHQDYRDASACYEKGIRILEQHLKLHG